MFNLLKGVGLLLIAYYIGAYLFGTVMASQSVKKIFKDATKELFITLLPIVIFVISGFFGLAFLIQFNLP